MTWHTTVVYFHAAWARTKLDRATLYRKHLQAERGSTEVDYEPDQILNHWFHAQELDAGAGFRIRDTPYTPRDDPAAIRRGRRDGWQRGTFADRAYIEEIDWLYDTTLLTTAEVLHMDAAGRDRKRALAFNAWCARGPGYQGNHLRTKYSADVLDSYVERALVQLQHILVARSLPPGSWAEVIIVDDHM